jgi:hypothetical protein
MKYTVIAFNITSSYHTMSKMFYSEKHTSLLHLSVKCFPLGSILRTFCALLFPKLFMADRIWQKVQNYGGCCKIHNHQYPKKFQRNGTVRIRHRCKKTTVLSCHRCLIYTGVAKMNNILIEIITLTTRAIFTTFLRNSRMSLVS